MVTELLSRMTHGELLRVLARVEDGYPLHHALWLSGTEGEPVRCPSCTRALCSAPDGMRLDKLVRGDDWILTVSRRTQGWLVKCLCGATYAATAQGVKLMSPPPTATGAPSGAAGMAQHLGMDPEKLQELDELLGPGDDLSGPQP